MYEAEIWGWKERQELKRIQKKSPDYVVAEETKREKLLLKTARRTLRYEEKLGKQEKESILGECWKIQKRRKLEKSQEDKRGF